MGFEPMMYIIHADLANQCFKPLSHSSIELRKSKPQIIKLASQIEFEIFDTTNNGTRTHTTCLEGKKSTINLYSHTTPKS